MAIGLPNLVEKGFYNFRCEHLKDTTIVLYLFRHRKVRTPVWVMKRLGVVDNLSYDGSILVRADFAPRRGSQVLDRKRSAIGKVFKVFGPVKKPFASVRPFKNPPLSIIGSEVYIEEGEHAEKPKEGRRS